jgi:hypothetical protein
MEFRNRFRRVVPRLHLFTKTRQGLALRVKEQEKERATIVAEYTNEVAYLDRLRQTMEKRIRNLTYDSRHHQKLRGQFDDLKSTKRLESGVGSVIPELVRITTPVPNHPRTAKDVAEFRARELLLELESVKPALE